MTTKELCFPLAGADGTSGDETAAAAVVQKLLSPYMQTETDPLGNVRGQCGSGGDGNRARCGAAGRTRTR